jgi:hypothetical protein
LLIGDKIEKIVKDFQDLQADFQRDPNNWILKKCSNLDVIIKEKKRNTMHCFKPNSMVVFGKAMVKTMEYARDLYPKTNESEIDPPPWNEAREKEYTQLISFAYERFMMPIYEDIYWSLRSPYTLQEDLDSVEIEQIIDLRNQGKFLIEISKHLFDSNQIAQNKSHLPLKSYQNPNMIRWLSWDLVHDNLKRRDFSNIVSDCLKECDFNRDNVK